MDTSQKERLLTVIRNQRCGACHLNDRREKIGAGAIVVDNEHHQGISRSIATHNLFLSSTSYPVGARSSRGASAIQRANGTSHAMLLLRPIRSGREGWRSPSNIPLVR